jgi:hypothetical protein
VRRPYPEDYIPEIPDAPTADHPDTFDMRRPPASIVTPKGSPTANFVRETGTIVIHFNENCVNPDLIRRSVNLFATEHGAASVREISVWVSDEVMVLDGPWLVANGYDRVLIANSKIGLHCWRKRVRLKKVEKA